MQKLPFEEVKKLMKRDHGSKGEEGLRPVERVPQLKLSRLRSPTVTRARKTASRTPETVVAETSISSSPSNLSMASTVPELDLKEAKRRLLEAQLALKRAQERETDAADETGSETGPSSQTGSSEAVPSSLVFYHDPIPRVCLQHYCYE
jgi:hypothetical protein